MRAERIPSQTMLSKVVMIAFFDGPDRTLMTIQLHDTLQGRKVPFEPLEEGKVTMYLCAKL